MSEVYNTIKEHQFQVAYHLSGFWLELQERARHHDESKTQEPEISMFKEYTPKLQELELGSKEYEQALVNMGEALKHHYQFNRHHPEHFENGINGMTLVDLLEMVCDWIASAKAKDIPVNLEYVSNRFGIGDQLRGILKNTIDQEYHK